MAEQLSDVAQRVLNCVCDALSEDLRPVCRCYQSLGTPVIPDCCDCDDAGTNGEVSIHFQRLFDADSESLLEVQRVRPCRGGTTAAQFRLVLARCRPIIDEHGELPSPQEITDAANDQIRDTELLWQSLACCTDLRIKIDDVSADLSEPGMCSVIYADISVEVRVPALPTQSPGVPA